MSYPFLTLNQLLANIEFVPEIIISETSLKFAFELCEDIDIKDMIFVAVTIEYSGQLWTGDKKLIEGLKKKGFNDFYQV